MNFPFNKEQFLDIFQNYNNTVFPAQIIFFIFALLIIFLAVKKYSFSDKVITLGLAFFWLWMGIVYHIIMFSTINKMAYIFGAIFVLQGFILLYYGAYKSVLTFRWQRGMLGYTGIMLILYALLIYPLLGYSFGHIYPKSPTFGLPCPTTIFTFGILLLLDKKYPVMVFLIPLIWSVIGFMAAVKFGIFEDIGLLAAGTVSAGLLVYSKRKIIAGHKKGAVS